MSNKENIGRTFKTISEMLTDRNFLSGGELDILKSFSNNELSAFQSSNQNIFCIDITKKVRIIYHLPKFKMSNDFKSYIEAGDFDLYIVVVPEKLTSTNLKSIREFEKKQEIQLNIQFFEFRELMFNITKHVLVPKHEVITDEQAIKQLVDQFHVKSAQQFPLMLKTDPIAKYYAIKPGTVVKITRLSPSAGEYIAYRYCV